MSYTASPAAMAAQSQAELVSQPLYSSVDMTSSSTRVEFFGATTNTTPLNTNVPNGHLNNPKFARIGGVRVLVSPIVHATNAAHTEANLLAASLLISYATTYRFTIGGNLKYYLEVPTVWLPGGIGPVARGAAQASSAYSMLNGESFGQFFRLKHLISIPPLQDFGATLEVWGTNTLGAAFRVYNYLDAEVGREVL